MIVIFDEIDYGGTRPTMEFRSDYDAIIVGSGAGGSTLALRLAQSGRNVLIVERGEFLRPSGTPTVQHADAYATSPAGSGEASDWPVGGQTKFYGAALYRLRESDFREVQHETGVSPAWPFSYWELEPYYQQAEELYRVHGAIGGDPSEPPRSGPFPYPPVPRDPIIGRLVDRLRASGASVSAIPTAIDYGPNGKCVLCASCDAFHCQVDAKMDAEIAALRPALATGRVRIATGTECLRVLTDDVGARATGVVLRRGGEEIIVNSDVVALCAGTQRSPALLRRSRTASHPNGLGNNADCLGRYLAGHSVGMIFPLISWRKLPPIFTKTFAVNSYHDGADDWLFPLGVIQAAGQMPFWNEASRVLRPAAHLVGQHASMCFYMTEAVPTREARLIFDGDELAGRVAPVHSLQSFERLRRKARDMFRSAGYYSVARRQAPVLWHQVGTARLGVDPAISVVDPACQVHGIKGLFVVDASVLPTAGAVNTGLTIIALALRAGDIIAGAMPSARPGQAEPGGRRRTDG
jgi:choline dehydrogenase-like flavoprotein